MCMVVHRCHKEIYKINLQKIKIKKKKNHIIILFLFLFFIFFIFYINLFYNNFFSLWQRWTTIHVTHDQRIKL